MSDVLDFEGVREQFPNRWDRADPRDALIERRNAHGWTVWLTDGADPHGVALCRDGDQFIGRCDCDGFCYHDGPCAHLCAVRKADVVNLRDINGLVTSIERVDADRDQERADDQAERIMADGGRGELQ